MSKITAGAAFLLTDLMILGAATGYAFAQAGPADSQCEKCIQSGISIYKSSRAEQEAYCSKIGMCPAAGAPAQPNQAMAPAAPAPAPIPAPAAAAAVRPPVVAANGAIPDGRYDCGMLSGRTLMGFGSIKIAGTSFQSMEHGVGGTSYSYSLAENGVILWGGPLTGIEGGGVKLLSTVYKGIEPHNNEPFFNITVQMNQNPVQQMSCTRVH